MNLSQGTMLRTDMRQILTPRMIQSMEILQMPLAALEERIEQELAVNPTLDFREGDPDYPPSAPTSSSSLDGSGDAPLGRESNRALEIDPNQPTAAEFDRLSKMSNYLENEEFSSSGSSGLMSRRLSDGDRDAKLDAMANSAARSGSLSEHLLDQWRLMEMSGEVRAAGRALIGYIEPDGYLRTDLATVATEQTRAVAMADLEAALKLIQTLEPAGVGARNLAECLLLQLDAIELDEDLIEEHDLPVERKLIREHLKDLELNRYPQIAKKMNLPIDRIQRAVRRLGRLNPHPGKLISHEVAQAINPDATIVKNEETGKWDVAMARDPSENLELSELYRKLLKKQGTDKNTKQFLTTHFRNARWLVDAIRQRKSTIARVIRVVVDRQQEFFENGPEFLKPLPMIDVADQLGIHVATVSRAVAEKYIQTPQGIFPLRRFFSGGTTSSSGQDMSWDAVKEKIKTIINEEDKSNPLNDDEIVEKVKEQGIELARRTVAKYRKILNIPTARQRRLY